MTMTDTLSSDAHPAVGTGTTPIARTADLSGVTDLAARREAERLYETVQAARIALTAAEQACPPSEEVRAAQVVFERTKAELDAACEVVKQTRFALDTARATLALWESDLTSPEIEAAAMALADAEDAYHETDGPTIVVDDDDEIVRCAASGLPLVEGDELLVCEATGDQVLRCVVLPGIPAAALPEVALPQPAPAQERA